MTAERQNETFGSLQLKNLGKSFGRRNVLSCISMTLPIQGKLALVGPNGAGKSTLVKLLLGIERVSTGNIVLSGEDITRLPIHRRVRKGLGYMAQESSAVMDLTVEDNLYLTPIIREAKKDFFEELMTEFGLIDIRRQKVRTLSTGERHKLEFCLCMAAQPDLVLLDEPFGGLEPKSVTKLCKMIQAQNAKGVGFIIADHRIADLQSIADSYIFLFEGKATYFENPATFFADTAVRKNFLGDD
jgi:lipopolysaccharide export system ATP-binding protein